LDVSDARSKVVIAAAALAAQRKGPRSAVVLDVRDEKAGAPADRQFVPGALATYLDTDFSGAPSKAAGKRPLPDIAAFEAKARSWGVDPDTLVVVYDDNAGAQAARAWWTFRWAVFDNVRILDGGLSAWREAGLPVSNTAASPAADGAVSFRAGSMPTLDADAAAGLARAGRLLDARGKAAYVGAPAEPGKPPTGHIPGALSAPSSLGVAKDGRFKTAEELQAQFGRLAGADAPLGVYCGSGNAAAHLLAALHIAGRAPALYVGSWSAWSADPARPVATGEEPGGAG
jgi:thiosulfate/3-mercaptopyruvate sulfurtransferase